MQFSEEEITKIISEKLFELTYKRISSANEELIDKGILTSITIAELAVELERVFSVSISFMEVNKENFNSVNAIKNLIQKTISRL